MRSSSLAMTASLTLALAGCSGTTSQTCAEPRNSPPATTSAAATPAAAEPSASDPGAGSDESDAVGYVTLICKPFCDDILEDGRTLGASPIVHEPFSVGTHRLTLKRQGFATRVVDVEVVAGDVAVQRVAMNQPHGSTAARSVAATTDTRAASRAPRPAPPDEGRPMGNEDVKRELAPKVFAGRATEMEIRMLKAACTALGDSSCRDRAAAELARVRAPR